MADVTFVGAWSPAPVRILESDIRSPRRVRTGRCAREEMKCRLGRLLTESSRHFVEWTSNFIERDRQDLRERFRVSLPQ